MHIDGLSLLELWIRLSFICVARGFRDGSTMGSKPVNDDRALTSNPKGVPQNIHNQVSKLSCKSYESNESSALWPFREQQSSRPGDPYSISADPRLAVPSTADRFIIRSLSEGTVADSLLFFVVSWNSLARLGIGESCPCQLFL